MRLDFAGQLHDLGATPCACTQLNTKPVRSVDARRDRLRLPRAPELARYAEFVRYCPFGTCKDPVGRYT